jgi:hypothetical protein
VILADDVIVEDLADFLWRRDAVARLDQRGFVFLADDVHAQLDALVADEHGGTGNELAHLVLTLAAERAVKRVLGIAAADLAHSCLRRPRRLGLTFITPSALKIRSARVTELTNAYKPSSRY